MRILMAGDVHGDFGHSKLLVRIARERLCDRIFVLGDFGYWEHEGAGRQYLDRLDRYANINNVPVYFLDGNHDKTSLLLEKYDDEEHLDKEGFILVRPYIRYARRGHRWTWDDITFAAFGGAYSTDKGWRLGLEKQSREFRDGKYPAESLWFPEEEMSDEDMNGFLADVSPVNVILAHDKPRASNPQWNRKNLPLCMPNQDRLQLAVSVLQPELFLHGHLHYRYDDVIAYAGRDGEMRVTHVKGLNCNQEAAEPGYKESECWWVLDTSERIMETLS